MDRTEVVVIGTGGVGAAAMWHLVRRGARVIGLDRFPPAHDRGSSHGETRMIRLAYFEHSDYVPLLRRSFELWSELSQASGLDLYRETGVVEIGPIGGEIVTGVRSAAAEHGLPIVNLTAAEVMDRFPGFTVPEEMEAVFEERAGFLRVEQCVAAQLDLAVRDGAELRTGVSVAGFTAEGDGVVVHTDQGDIGADRLVVTAGPWASEVLADLDLPLRVLRKSLFWFEAGPTYDVDAGCPGFLFDTPTGVFYGFPALDHRGVKLAEHSGGAVVHDPLTVDRAIDARDEQSMMRFLESHLPGIRHDRRTHHSVCMYTSTPDGHFVVDRHPEHPQVSFVAGLSGHGFKMTSVLGEIMSDYVTKGTTDFPTAFLSVSRFGK